MKEVNIQGADELDRYESTKRTVESFGEDKKGLEELEIGVRKLVERLTEPDKQLVEDMKYLLCYVGKRIEQLLYGLE